MRGLAYRRKGDFDRAIADYSQMIRLNPKNASAYYRRADAYYRKKDNASAIADFKKAAELGNADADKKLHELGVAR